MRKEVRESKGIFDGLPGSLALEGAYGVSCVAYNARGAAVVFRDVWGCRVSPRWPRRRRFRRAGGDWRVSTSPALEEIEIGQLTPNSSVSFGSRGPSSR